MKNPFQLYINYIRVNIYFFFRADTYMYPSYTWVLKHISDLLASKYVDTKKKH